MKTLGEMQDSLYARAKTEKDAKFNTLMDKEEFSITLRQ